jgi:hypothetical protein
MEEYGVDPIDQFNQVDYDKLAVDVKNLTNSYINSLKNNQQG